MRHLKRLLLSGALLVACAARATLLPPVLEEHTLKRLEQIQAETVILEAKAARARVQRELEAGGIDATLPPLTMKGGTMAVPTLGTGLPVVQEIYGTGKQLRVRLVLPDGTLTELAAGEPVPGGTLTVTAITSREVRVSDGSRERTLAFH